MSPLCQTHIEPTRVHEMEPFYPLHSYVCNRCFLVQLPEHVGPSAIFEEYAYFSSYSDTWLAHSRKYVDDMSARLGLGASSLVVEIASNDGYLLQYFAAKNIRVLGVEPAKNVAKVAIEKGIPTITEFFGRETATTLRNARGAADLILGNNVLAHVPDINDFVGGVRVLLKPGGVVTMEFPHLLRLVDENQFDTIYHEHFSYLSFTTVEQVFAAQGLTLFDVDEIPTHGGSLRIYGRHVEDTTKPVTDRVRRSQSTRSSLGGPEPGSVSRVRREGQGHEASDPRVSDRGQERRQVYRGLRSAWQRQHAVELLWHPNGLHRLHGRSESVQAGQVHAGYANSYRGSGTHSRGASRLPLHPSMESQGRGHASDGVYSRLGWEVRRADPGSQSV